MEEYHLAGIKNMNHFFSDPKFGEDWFTFQGTYTNFVNQIPNNGTIVEVGSWKGKSAAFLAVEIVNSNKNLKLFCVDTWLGSPEHRDTRSRFYDPNIDKLYESFLSNTEPVKSIISPIRKNSIEASKDFQDNSLDIVFLDACHEYECVKKDIECWLPKVKVGGILSGHDYNNNWPGVNLAVHEAFGSDVQIVNHEFCWIHIKKS